MLQNGESSMNTDLILYYNPLTVNSIKVMLLCNALDIVPEYKLIHLQKGEHKSDLFLKLNPDGRVPVLMDGDFVLNESAAILHYLAHKHQSALWPGKIKDQAQVLKWLFWQGNDWNNTVGAYAHQQVVLPHWRDSKPEAFSEQHLERFEKIMSIFNRALNGKEYLATDHLTVADISIGSYLMFTDQAKIPLAHYQNVRRWLDKLRVTTWWQETQQQLLKTLSPKS
jgi:glutathione S-transferase